MGFHIRGLSVRSIYQLFIRLRIEGAELYFHIAHGALVARGIGRVIYHVGIVADLQVSGLAYNVMVKVVPSIGSTVDVGETDIEHIGLARHIP